jgi:hypothetical protein
MNTDLEKTDEIPKDELDALLEKLRGATADSVSGTPDEAVTLRHISELVQETKKLAQQLIDASTKTDRRSSQTAREDMEHGAGAWLSPVERKLRTMLAFAYSKPGHLYGDDGELQDSQMPFPIDYMRDSIDHIEKMIHDRRMTELAKVKL